MKRAIKHQGFLLPIYLLLLLLFLPSVQPARTPVAQANGQLLVEYVDRFGGGMQYAAIQGDYVYIAENDGLTVLDITNPNNFIQRSHLFIESQFALYVRAIKIVGDYVYCISDSGNLWIISVADPDQPSIVSQFALPGLGISNAMLSIDGQRAYVIGKFSAITGLLSVIDISSPSNPVLLKQAYIRINIDNIDFDVDNNRLYVKDHTISLTIYDIQDLDNIQQIGRYTAPDISHILADNNLLIVQNNIGLSVLNVEDPENIAVVGSYTPPIGYTAQIVEQEGTRIYLGTDGAGSGRLDVLDLSPNGTLTLQGYALIEDAEPVAAFYELPVSEGRLFALRHDAWQLIDLSIPTQPVLHGRYPAIRYANDIEIVSDRAYIASEWTGLQIVDLDSPTNQMQLGGYSSISASSVDIEGNLAFVTGGKLQIIDIANASMPGRIGQYEQRPYGSDVQISNNLAYIAAEKDGLQIINISNPNTPTFQGGNDIPASSSFLQIRVNRAYILDERSLSNPSAVFYVMDISNPSQPTIIGSYQDTNVLAYPAGLDIAGEFAYIPTGESLQILDISDPAQIMPIGRYATPARSVQVVGNRAYIGTLNGLQILDISNPTSPTLLGAFSGLEWFITFDIEVAGDLVYAAAGADGVYIFHVTENSAATPTDTPTHTTTPTSTSTSTSTPTQVTQSPTVTTTGTPAMTVTPSPTGSPVPQAPKQPDILLPLVIR